MFCAKKVTFMIKMLLVWNGFAPKVANWSLLAKIIMLKYGFWSMKVSNCSVLFNLSLIFLYLVWLFCLVIGLLYLVEMIRTLFNGSLEKRSTRKYHAGVIQKMFFYYLRVKKYSSYRKKDEFLLLILKQSKKLNTVLRKI